MSKLLAAGLFATTIALLPLSPALAHRNGCHRWHSCPSDTGSYVCGDLGHYDQCPSTSNRQASSEPQANEVCPTGGRIQGFNGITSDSDNVNLRTGTSTASSVVRVMPPETLAQIHSWRSTSEGRWAWITTSQGQNGWAREPYVDCVPLD